MDLALYLRVLWRFRLLVVAGLVLSVVLALVSVVTVRLDDGKPSLRYRQAEVWGTDTTLLVTQPGFPQGRSIFEEVVKVPGTDPPSFVPRFADPSRFSSLAVLYARIAESDVVKRIMLRDGRIPGNVVARPVVEESSGSVLPIIDITGQAESRRESVLVAARASRAIRQYVATEQTRNGIAEASRVVLTVINGPNRSLVLASRSKTRPIFVFTAVMVLVLGLVFVLENLRPRVRAVPAEATSWSPLRVPRSRAGP